MSKMKVERYIKDGKVAVLYSRGYGAGWSTWNTSAAERCLFDTELAQAVLAGADCAELERLVESWDLDIYAGGLGGIAVRWVEQGDRFEVEEYDGAESVRVLSPDDGWTA